MAKKRIRGWLGVQRKALRKSIKDKWIPLASGEFRGKEEPDCALCITNDQNCDGCIVSASAQRRECRSTPYPAWFTICPRRMCYFRRMANTPKAVRAAKKMLAWLRALDAELTELLDGPAKKRSRAKRARS